MFAPITRALIEAGQVTTGDEVLDIAGGLGEPSIAISSVVGPSGAVICTDAVGEMVAAARREASKATLANIEFGQCLAESLPFSDNKFDKVICRLGVMLFPDPGAAIHEMLRVLKPEGLLSVAVWSNRPSNPFFQVVAEALSRFVDSPPEDPEAPGAFRFAEAGKLARLVKDAGAAVVRERLLDFELFAAITPEQFWELRVELSDTLRAKVASLSSEQIQQVTQEVEAAGRAFYVDGCMRFPGQALIITGRKA
jgi:SAM-dependent methyltransferase